MDLTFASKDLEKLAADYDLCRRKFGKKMTKVLAQRLNVMREAETLEQVRHAPGRFHELTGNRKGQWSCDLDHPYRLIFTPREYPIPTNAHGQYVWLEICGVEIIDITDYH